MKKLNISILKSQMQFMEKYKIGSAIIGMIGTGSTELMLNKCITGIVIPVIGGVLSAIAVKLIEHYFFNKNKK